MSLIEYLLGVLKLFIFSIISNLFFKCDLIKNAFTQLESKAIK